MFLSFIEVISMKDNKVFEADLYFEIIFDTIANVISLEICFKPVVSSRNHKHRASLRDSTRNFLETSNFQKNGFKNRYEIPRSYRVKRKNN